MSATYHSIHEFDKAPESNGVVLHDRVDWSQKVTHPLNVAKVLVVLVVGQKHLLHLLEMDIGPGLGIGRIRIRMWDILSSEERDIAVCTMNILLYRADPVEWGTVSLSKSTT
jgi:hypothetical protein